MASTATQVLVGVQSALLLQQRLGVDDDLPLAAEVRRHHLAHHAFQVAGLRAQVGRPAQDQARAARVLRRRARDCRRTSSCATRSSPAANPDAGRSSRCTKRFDVAPPSPRSVSVCSLNVMFSPLPCASVTRSFARRRDAVVVAGLERERPCRLTRRGEGEAAIGLDHAAAAGGRRWRRGGAASARATAARRAGRGGTAPNASSTCSPRQASPSRCSATRRPSCRTSSAAAGCGASRNVHCRARHLAAHACRAWVRRARPGACTRAASRAGSVRRCVVCVGTAASPLNCATTRVERPRRSLRPRAASPTNASAARPTDRAIARADQRGRTSQRRRRLRGVAAGASVAGAPASSSTRRRRTAGRCCPPCRDAPHRAAAPASACRACAPDAVRRRSAATATASESASATAAPFQRHAIAAATTAHGNARASTSNARRARACCSAWRRRVDALMATPSCANRSRASARPGTAARSPAPATVADRGAQPETMRLPSPAHVRSRERATAAARALSNTARRCVAKPASSSCGMDRGTSSRVKRSTRPRPYAPPSIRTSPFRRATAAPSTVRRRASPSRRAAACRRRRPFAHVRRNRTGASQTRLFVAAGQALLDVRGIERTGRLARAPAATQRTPRAGSARTIAFVGACRTTSTGAPMRAVPRLAGIAPGTTRQSTRRDSTHALTVRSPARRSGTTTVNATSAGSSRRAPAAGWLTRCGRRRRRRRSIVGKPGASQMPSRSRRARHARATARGAHAGHDDDIRRMAVAAVQHRPRQQHRHQRHQQQAHDQQRPLVEADALARLELLPQPAQRGERRSVAARCAAPGGAATGSAAQPARPARRGRGTRDSSCTPRRRASRTAGASGRSSGSSSTYSTRRTPVAASRASSARAPARSARGSRRASPAPSPSSSAPVSGSWKRWPPWNGKSRSSAVSSCTSSTSRRAAARRVISATAPSSKPSLSSSDELRRRRCAPTAARSRSRRGQAPRALQRRAARAGSGRAGAGRRRRGSRRDAVVARSRRSPKRSPWRSASSSDARRQRLRRRETRPARPRRVGLHHRRASRRRAATRSSGLSRSASRTKKRSERA